jgi:hypothetical protein
MQTSQTEFHHNLPSLKSLSPTKCQKSKCNRIPHYIPPRTEIWPSLGQKHERKVQNIMKEMNGDKVNKETEFERHPVHAVNKE